MCNNIVKYKVLVSITMRNYRRATLYGKIPIVWSFWRKLWDQLLTTTTKKVPLHLACNLWAQHCRHHQPQQEQIFRSLRLKCSNKHWIALVGVIYYSFITLSHDQTKKTKGYIESDWKISCLPVTVDNVYVHNRIHYVHNRMGKWGWRLKLAIEVCFCSQCWGVTLEISSHL